MKRLALVLLATAALSGCDEKQTSSTGTPGGIVPAGPSVAGGGAPVKSESAELLKDAVASPPQSGKDPGRALFDGDTRALEGDGAVSTGGADFTSAPKVVVPLEKPPKKDPDEPPVPQPNLPQVALPAAVDGEGPEGNAVFRAFHAFQEALYDAAYPMLGRLGWGARERRNQPTAMTPYRVTVHHTASKTPMSEAETIKAVKAIQNFHMDGRTSVGKENFDDIGYHFLIDGQGRVIEGRSPDTMGAHAKGANDGNIGVAMIGDFNETKPTDAQVASLERLIVFLAVKYRRDPVTTGFLEGHKHYDPTSCPGKNLAAILDALRLRIDAEADQVVKKLAPAEPSAGDAGSGFKPVIVTQNP